MLENTALTIVAVVPSNVKVEEPAKDPAELNCTWLVDPPGLEAGTAEITEVVEGSTIT